MSYDPTLSPVKNLQRVLASIRPASGPATPETAVAELAILGYELAARAILSSQRGVANGVAPLNEFGLIPNEYLDTENLDIQLRRGTNADRLDSVPLSGEPFWVTDTNKLWIGDVAGTVGGVAVTPPGYYYSPENDQTVIWSPDETASQLYLDNVGNTYLGYPAGGACLYLRMNANGDMGIVRDGEGGTEGLSYSSSWQTWSLSTVDSFAFTAATGGQITSAGALNISTTGSFGEIFTIGSSGELDVISSGFLYFSSDSDISMTTQGDLSMQAVQAIQFDAPQGFKFNSGIPPTTESAGIIIGLDSVIYRKGADSLATGNGDAWTFGGAVMHTVGARNGAGAVPINCSVVELTTTGAAQALTLANGTHGQELTIVHGVDGGSAVLTPTTKTGYTTVTFTNVGESVTLVYITTRGWCIRSIYGAVAA